MPRFEAVNDSVLADGTSEAGSTLGTIAPRVEEATANPAAWTATSPSSRGRLARPSRAATSSPPVHAPQQQRRPQQQEPAVDGVGHRASPEPEHDQRDQPDQPQHAHPERGAGQLEHLHGHGHSGQLEADEPERVAQPQPPERGMAQRLDVDRGPSQPPQWSHDPPRIGMGAVERAEGEGEVGCRAGLGSGGGVGVDNRRRVASPVGYAPPPGDPVRDGSGAAARGSGRVSRRCRRSGSGPAGGRPRGRRPGRWRGGSRGGGRPRRPGRSRGGGPRGRPRPGASRGR